MAPPNRPCSCAMSCHLWVAGLVRGCWFVVVGTVVVCRGLCGLCGQWLARADGGKGYPA